MQTIEYFCDWCKKGMPIDKATRLTVRPVFVPMDRQSLAAEREMEKPLEHAERVMQALKDRQKDDGQRSMEVDVCEGCLTQFRMWIESRSTS